MIDHYQLAVVGVARLELHQPPAQLRHGNVGWPVVLVVVARVLRFAPVGEVDPRRIAAGRARLARRRRLRPIGQEAELWLQEGAALAAPGHQRPAAAKTNGRLLPMPAVEAATRLADGELHRLQLAPRPLVQPAAAPDALGGHDLAARRELRQGQAQVALQFHLFGHLHVGQVVGVQGHHVNGEAVLGQHAAAAELVDQVAVAHRCFDAVVVAGFAGPSFRLLFRGCYA